MQILHLGHNGFAVGEPSSPLLIDPLLHDSYADEYSSSPVEIYPPRVVMHHKMPRPSGVLLTHEHSDHFHLPSLAMLSTSIPIYVGPLMLEPVKRSIERLGFTVTLLEYESPTEIAGVLVELFPAGPDTVLWEARVSQVWVRESDSLDGGVYFAVDATISSTLVGRVKGGRRPSAIAMSNNAQITPSGVFGSFDNLRTWSAGDESQDAFAGLNILRELVVGTREQLGDDGSIGVIICGGGFLKDYEQLGPFPFSEQQDLGQAATSLSLAREVLGPEPGSIIDVTDRRCTMSRSADWIKVDHQRHDELKRRREIFMSSGAEIDMCQVIPTRNAAEERRAREVIENHLEYLARSILLSDLGGNLVAAAADLGIEYPLSIVCTFDRCVTSTYGLSVGRAQFERIQGVDVEVAPYRFPFGLHVRGADLAGVLTGRIQIWDIAGVAMRGWYVGDQLSSPVATMFDALGEQTRPSVACSVYGQQADVLASIDSTTAGSNL